MSLIAEYLEQTWAMIAEMGAFLLLGFAISAVLHRYLKQSWVEKLMGRPGLPSILWGSVIGVPMPLCSCGVIPVTMSLRDKGASKGASVSFLTSTPQTGVDSILATYAMLGPVFTIYKVIVAFLSGIAVGFVTSLTDSSPPKAKASTDSTVQAPIPTIAESLRYGFFTMPGDLASALLFGFLVAGMISAFAPADLLANMPGGTISAILLTTLISVPFYICSTGSIPLALALVYSGLPIGAALVLLIAGPATNVTTIATMRKVLGGRSTVIYVAGVVLSAWIAAGIYQYFIDDGSIAQNALHLHDQIPLWKHIGGGVLLVVLTFPRVYETLVNHKHDHDLITNMQTAKITIAGMTCSHCEGSINKGLDELPFTKAVVSVNRSENLAIIQGDTFDQAVIKQKVESLGFEYKGIEIS